MQWLAIVLLSIVGCITYGILHDQVTARICVEYFTIGHPPLIPSEDPTVLGVFWGIVATWWVGVILGVPLATLARMGSRPKLNAGKLLRPLVCVMTASALLAVLAGLSGYVAASRGWVWLVGPLAQSVPREKHVAFLVDLWAHSASYLGGFVGGIGLMIWTWRSRHRAPPAGDSGAGRGPAGEIAPGPNAEPPESAADS